MASRQAGAVRTRPRRRKGPRRHRGADALHPGGRALRSGCQRQVPAPTGPTARWLSSSPSSGALTLTQSGSTADLSFAPIASEASATLTLRLDFGAPRPASRPVPGWPLRSGADHRRHHSQDRRKRRPRGTSNSDFLLADANAYGTIYPEHRHVLPGSAACPEPSRSRSVPGRGQRRRSSSPSPSRAPPRPSGATRSRSGPATSPCKASPSGSRGLSSGPPPAGRRPA